MRGQYDKEKGSPNADTIIVQIRSLFKALISVKTEDRSSKKSKDKNRSKRRETAAKVEAEIEPEGELEAEHVIQAAGLPST
jgi:hypothetical protein